MAALEAGPSVETKKRKRHVNESIDGEKEQRKANFMRKILDDDKATKAASFAKRKPTLMKKAEELQTLCGVSVHMVCYEPNGKVDVWPPPSKEQPDVKEGMKEAFESYRSLEEKQKHESNLLEFLMAKKRKLEEKKYKLTKKRLDELSTSLPKYIDGLSGDSLRNAVIYMNDMVKAIREQKRLLSIEGNETGIHLDDEQIDRRNILEFPEGKSLAECAKDFSSDDICNFGENAIPVRALPPIDCSSDSMIMLDTGSTLPPNYPSNSTHEVNPSLNVKENFSVMEQNNNDILSGDHQSLHHEALPSCEPQSMDKLITKIPQDLVQAIKASLEADIQKKLQTQTLEMAKEISWKIVSQLKRLNPDLIINPGLFGTPIPAAGSPGDAASAPDGLTELKNPHCSDSINCPPPRDVDVECDSARVGFVEEKSCA